MVVAYEPFDAPAGSLGLDPAERYAEELRRMAAGLGVPKEVVDGGTVNYYPMSGYAALEFFDRKQAEFKRKFFRRLWEALLPGTLEIFRKALAKDDRRPRPRKLRPAAGRMLKAARRGRWPFTSWATTASSSSRGSGCGPSAA